jgi:hypothetical protein
MITIRDHLTSGDSENRATGAVVLRPWFSFDVG